MADLQWVKEIKSIEANLLSDMGREQATETVNNLLQEGWKLLSIQTGCDYIEDGISAAFQTSRSFYILGR